MKIEIIVLLSSSKLVGDELYFIFKFFLGLKFFWVNIILNYYSI